MEDRSFQHQAVLYRRPEAIPHGLSGIPSRTRQWCKVSSGTLVCALSGQAPPSASGDGESAPIDAPTRNGTSSTISPVGSVELSAGLSPPEASASLSSSMVWSGPGTSSIQLAGEPFAGPAERRLPRRPDRPPRRSLRRIDGAHPRIGRSLPANGRTAHTASLEVFGATVPGPRLQVGPGAGAHNHRPRIGSRLKIGRLTGFARINVNRGSVGQASVGRRGALVSESGADHVECFMIGCSTNNPGC